MRCIYRCTSEEIKNELTKLNDSAYETWSALKEWCGFQDKIELDRSFKDFKNLRLDDC